MNPAATALIEAAKRRYDECLAKGVDEYICHHVMRQEITWNTMYGGASELRVVYRDGLTFEEDAGL